MLLGVLPCWSIIINELFKRVWGNYFVKKHLQQAVYIHVGTGFLDWPSCASATEPPVLWGRLVSHHPATHNVTLHYIIIFTFTQHTTLIHTFTQHTDPYIVLRCLHVCLFCILRKFQNSDFEHTVMASVCCKDSTFTSTLPVMLYIFDFHLYWRQS